VNLSALRRRWPEAALAVALVLVALFTGLAWRALAIVLLGGVAVFGVRRRVRDVVRAGALTILLLVVTIAVSFTIDIGALTGGYIPRVASNAGSKQLGRTMSIGKLSLQVGRGRFIVEDLRIDGAKPADVPFFTAKRINIDLPWWQIVRARELSIRSVEMGDWTMQIEKFADGDSLPPRFKRKSTTPPGPKRFTTTLNYLHAFRGQFTYIDHSTWRTVARNLDIYVRNAKETDPKTGAVTSKYLGTGSITNGTTQINRYLPMRTDMRVKFQIDDGGIVRLPEIVLLSDGAQSMVTGQVDFGHWPEMIYHVDSRLNLWRMRELYFANDSWRSRGEARFKGTFRLFKGGHLLKGDFTSSMAHVNQFSFPDLRGSLEWEPHRFEVTHATARFYDGVATFSYLMAPLSDPRPGVARWEVTYQDVDLSQLSGALPLRGIRMLGRASGQNLLEWPLGRFSEHRGNGSVTIAPPAGIAVLPRAPMAAESEIHAEPPEYGPERNLHLFPKPTAVGGELTYRFDPEWVDVAPSHLATERTYVEFQGRTAYGDRSEFPFYARSADWQESDRLLAGIITAFGSPTGVITVGGHGEFHGAMTKSFKAPLIQGEFAGDGRRGGDVVWGRAAARLSIENGYVDVARAVVTREQSSVEAEGRFSLGYPRKDRGEEINARFVLRDRPMSDLRHAFELDDWPLDGKVSGEFRLYDRYTRPVGYGRLVIADAVAWGEPFERASAPMRFEGHGVRLDAIEIAKAGGTVTGAAYVGWDGRYSFNARGDRIPLETLASIKYGKTEWSGLMRFSAGGASTFKNPRFEVQMGAEDVFLGEEGIGAVAIGFDVKDRLLTIGQLEAAGLGVSGSGQIEMSPNVDADLSFRFNRTLLDPYVRLFEPRISPYARAVASGSMRVVGQLANWDRLSASATVDSLDVSLFDYQIQNDGPIRISFDKTVITAQELKLAGKDTRLEVSGGVWLTEDRIAVKVSGDGNLGILPVFFKDVRSSGRTVLRAEINGSLGKPQFSGAADITDGRLRLMSLPQSLQAVNGRVAFGDDGIRLEDLTGQIAGGKVRFGGRVGLNGFSVGQLSLTASGENMEFRYPEGFRSKIDAQLDLVGTLAAPTLRGTVTVKDSLYNKRVDIVPGLVELAGSARASSSGGGSSAATSMPVRFDVRIQAPSSLRVESNLAHIVSSADLVLRGSYDRPQLFGRAEVERGEALFEGKRYLVRHGSIDFSNPTKIEPFVDLEGETLIRVPGQTYVVNVQLVGTVERLDTQLTSDPPLSRVEILSLLFGGDTARAEARDAELRTLQRDESQRDLVTSRLQQAAVGVVTAPITKAVEQTFGLDAFQITPSMGTDSYQRFSPTARVTVGKRISNKVYLTFSRSLNSPGGADQLILLEYDQNDRLSWILSRNEDGTYALDVRVRHIF
jgi:hypothetical protein